MFPARRAARAPARMLASCAGRERRLVGVEGTHDRPERQRLTFDLDPAAHEVPDSFSVTIGVEGPLERPDHAPVCDAEDGMAPVRHADAHDGADDAVEEVLPGLAPRRLVKPALAPRRQLAGTALLDPAPGQAAPLPHAEL